MVGSMKAQYDSTADALYLQLGARQPDGVVEMAAGVHVDTTDGGEIIGIEILNASEKINLDTLLTYTLDIDPGIMRTGGESVRPSG